jgi:hypothetical protein
MELLVQQFLELFLLPEFWRLDDPKTHANLRGPCAHASVLTFPTLPAADAESLPSASDACHPAANSRRIRKIQGISRVHIETMPTPEDQARESLITIRVKRLVT